MKNNIVYDKSFELSILLCKCAKEVKESYHEFDLTSQLVRSSTSVHANIREALFGSSKRDFVARLRISLREAEETRYWLEMFEKMDYISNEKFEKFYADMTEVCKLLHAIINTTRKTFINSVCTILLVTSTITLILFRIVNY